MATYHYSGTRRDVTRAARRLGVLEVVMLFGAVIFALLGGGITAFLVSSATGLSGRSIWVLASLLFFIVPALTLSIRERREDQDRAAAKQRAKRDESTNGIR